MEWLNYLANTKVQNSPEGVILLVCIALGLILFCVLMFIGLKKCINFGKCIGHSVISFNIILVALPVLSFYVMLMLRKANVIIPFEILLVIATVSWGFVIIYDIIICKKYINYTLGYIFFHFFIGFLLAALLISVVYIAIFIIILIFVGAGVHNDAYDISLTPVNGGIFDNKIIRARRNSMNPNILDGENGERFEYVSENQYRLVLSFDDSLGDKLYRIC